MVRGENIRKLLKGKTEIRKWNYEFEPLKKEKIINNKEIDKKVNKIKTLFCRWLLIYE